MPDVLIYGDTVRSPELRHEVPIVIGDAFLYLEKGDRRVVAMNALEIPRVREDVPEVEILPTDSLGLDELVSQGLGWPAVEREIAQRACEHVGISNAAVPPTFPLEVADHLRANGVEISVDRELFEQRRRAKNETELDGIRRAQRACEAALDAARELMRRAEPNGGGLEVDGEPLTSEWIKSVIERVFAEHGVEGSDMIVSHGPQSAVGHNEGSGQILPDEPIVFDLFPKDRQTGCYADMTRTYVIGTPSDEVQGWYRHVKEALDRSTAEVKPGASGRALFDIACDIFEQAGYKTQRTKNPDEVLEEGFFHSLGHGVGLEVHELPSMGRMGEDLIPGDVITIEPGLYKPGYGGLRLEDLVVVTNDGYEVITKYPYDLTP